MPWATFSGAKWLTCIQARGPRLAWQACAARDVPPARERMALLLTLLLRLVDDDIEGQVHALVVTLVCSNCTANTLMVSTHAAAAFHGAGPFLGPVARLRPILLSTLPARVTRPCFKNFMLAKGPCSWLGWVCGKESPPFNYNVPCNCGCGFYVMMALQTQKYAAELFNFSMCEYACCVLLGRVCLLWDAAVATRCHDGWVGGWGHGL